MAEPENPAQIAPGYEMYGQPIDEPYVGYRPGVHIGYPLNGSFWEGAETGQA